MILESLVIVTCVYGTSDPCNTMLSNYAHERGLDKRAEKLDHSIKQAYPKLHFSGVLIASAFHRKYKFLLYKNVWFSGDYSDIMNPENIITYKYSF